MIESITESDERATGAEAILSEEGQPLEPMRQSGGGSKVPRFARLGKDASGRLGLQYPPKALPDTVEAVTLAGEAFAYADQIEASGLAGDALELAPMQAEKWVREAEPRDPVERLLIVQLVQIHGQMQRMLTLSARQKDPEQTLRYTDATTRLANLGRRQALAWAALRSPTRVVVNGEQVNVSQGPQLVHNSGTVPHSQEPDSAERTSTTRRDAS